MSTLAKKSIPEGKTFLLVEDMGNLRKKMIEDLKTFIPGVKFLEAENLMEAFMRSKEGKIDMIISDWNLPDGTGLEFLMKIKAEDKFKETPFLMCTTMDNVEDILNAIAAGADEYLVKPWSIEELQEKVLSSWFNHNS